MPDLPRETVDRSLEQLVNAIDCAEDINVIEDDSTIYLLSELPQGLYCFKQGVTLDYTIRVTRTVEKKDRPTRIIDTTDIHYQYTDNKKFVFKFQDDATIVSDNDVLNLKYITGNIYERHKTTQKQNKLVPGDNIILENNGATTTISASGGGTTDYGDLLNKPREKYTPKTETVSFTALADDKVYDIGGDFTLTGDDNQELEVHEGDILSVGALADGKSNIVLFCNYGVFSFESDLADWQDGRTINAGQFASAMAYKWLPTTTVSNEQVCNVQTLPEGAYIAQTAVKLTGWTDSQGVNISKMTPLRKNGNTVMIDYKIYQNYVTATATNLYASTSYVDNKIDTEINSALADIIGEVNANE